jgi:hypothetical protein
MTIKIGGYYVQLNEFDSKKVRPVSEAHEQEISRCLDYLATTFEDVNWVLSGGLSLGLNKGLYRLHDDIDLGLDVNDLEKFVGIARENSYDLFSRRVMFKTSGSKKIDIYRKVSPEESIQKGLRHLRILKMKEDSPLNKNSLLDAIDVYLHTVQNGRVVSFLQPNINVEAQKHISANYLTSSGRLVGLRSPEYIKTIKEGNPHLKDLYDMFIIRGQQPPRMF